jgi:2-C-methyl-D-erythritol 4-phosphate cytidylyltransferase
MSEKKEKQVAIVLAAGRGKRMNSAVQKQYLLINKRPVLYYSLAQFQACPFIDEIILVTGKDEIDYCRREIVERYGIEKVKKIVAGGAERYHSVYQGLLAAGEDCTYVYIHDGARPFVDQDILRRAEESVRKYQACVVGMPVKDTIKISDGEGFADYTPPREQVWMIQTPQVFSYPVIYEAYREILSREDITVTDDAMVLETVTGQKAKLVPGSYENIKITTPEDLQIAELFVQYNEI